MAQDSAIAVRDLRKTYGGFEALKGINLDIDSGEVFALLGPNGAGKTTAVEILEGHRQRTSGEVRVLGLDPATAGSDLKERIGIVLQEPGVDPYLSVEETIDLYRGYYPTPLETREVLALVDLEEQRAARVLKLSGGRRRRLDVAVGLAGDPDIIFLDEPTTGFDPAARHGAWQMIENLKQLGKTILLTTHYMDEAEQLANRVAIIRRGEIIALGRPAELAGADLRTRIAFRLPAGSEDLIRGIEASQTTEGGLVEIETDDPTALLFELTSRATKRGADLLHLSVSRSSLEDTYLRLVEGGDESE